MGVALITDPDDITRNVDVQIDPDLRTVTIVNNSTGISANGVTGQCLYSYLKEEWKANNTLIKTDFPMVAITPEKFEFVDDWEPADDTTRKLIRTAGWRELFANTLPKREYLGVITLGNIDNTGKEVTSGDRAYYAFGQVGQVPTSNTTFTFYGPVNEAIQTYDRTGLDYRANTVTTFIRTEGKTYDQTNTPDIGVVAGATIDYGVYRFPLSEGTDLNVTLTDAQIEGAYATRLNAANITYLSSNVTSSSLYSPDLTGGPHEFTVLIDATSGADVGDNTGNLSKNEIYSWVQYQLRKTVNIDGNEGANTKPGYTQDLLLQFVGTDLKTLNVNNEDDVGLGDGESGVAITNFNNNDINSLQFRDNAQLERSFPFNSSLVVAFNNNLLTDSDAVFTSFYEYTTSNTISSFDISGASGQSATFTSTGAVDFPGALLNQFDYIEITGSAFANNNSVWQIDNTPSDLTFNATLIDDIGLARNETGITGGTLRRNPVDSPQAIVVQDASGKDIANNTLNVLGGTSISYLYAYDSNVQGGRDASEGNRTDPAVVFRAIGTDKAQYVQLDGQTIERTPTKTYSLISGLERNYSNP
jgi:hypothetical protein